MYRTSNLRSDGVRCGEVLAWAITAAMKKTTLVAAVALLTVILIRPLVAGEDERSNLEAALEQRSSTLAKLVAGDTDGSGAAHIEKIRSWIGQGQAYLASEDYDRVQRILNRVDALTGFVQALEARVVAKRAAEKVEMEAKSAVEMADAASAEAKRLADRYAELEAKGL